MAVGETQGVTDVWIQCGEHEPIEDSSIHTHGG